MRFLYFQLFIQIILNVSSTASSSTRLLKSNIRCKNNKIRAKFVISTTNDHERAISAKYDDPKMSYNVTTCLPSPKNMYCKHKDTIWNNPLPCRHRYKSNRTLRINCFVASMKDIGTQNIFKTFGVKINFFENVQEKNVTIAKLIPFTPFFIC